MEGFGEVRGLKKYLFDTYFIAFGQSQLSIDGDIYQLISNRARPGQPVQELAGLASRRVSTAVRVSSERKPEMLVFCLFVRDRVGERG